MIVKKIIFSFLFLYSLVFSVQSQPQINYVFNRINYGEIDAFYRKLFSLRIIDSGTVNIVHIGDSHIQADMLTSVVRKGLQQNFGNAGRGLVFPYQLAKSNAPNDISSSSNSVWQFSRLARADQPIAEGIAGFCIQTTRPGATINMSLKPVDDVEQSFKKLKFFIDDASTTSWMLKVGEDDMPYSLSYNNEDSFLYKQITLPTAINNFSLTLSSGALQSFYGVSLEKDEPGIIYHSIGVNGARYAQYNATPLFWQQLPGLKADLYIVSMGTNEAQASSFDENAFTQEVSLFIQKLKAASPNAAILLTTAPDSYKGGRSNTVLRQLNTALLSYCSSNHVALWDLYKVANGYGAARNWLRKGLMNKDRVHFTAAGYQIQGQLLLDALMSGYKNFTANY